MALEQIGFKLFYFVTVFQQFTYDAIVTSPLVGWIDWDNESESREKSETKANR